MSSTNKEYCASCKIFPSELSTLFCTRCGKESEERRRSITSLIKLYERFFCIPFTRTDMCEEEPADRSEFLAAKKADQEIELTEDDFIVEEMFH